MHVAGEVENAATARHGVGGLGEADDERFVLIQVIMVQVIASGPAAKFLLAS